MIRTPRVLIVFLLLVGAGALVWLRYPRSLPDASDARAPAEVSETETPLPPARDPVPTAPLPPPDAPISEIASDLQRRADAGDRSAACRLGIELMLCEQLERFSAPMQQQLEHDENEQARAGDLERADKIAEMQLHVLDRKGQCNVRPDGLKRPGVGWRYLRQAALAGQRDAVLLFAEGPIAYAGDAAIRTPEFDAWRREMPALLQRELAGGNPEMATALWMRHSSDAGPSNGLVPDDPVLADAYRLLAARLMGRDAGSDRRLDAHQSRRAAELATRWHARHFDNRRFKRDRWIGGTHMIALTLVDMQTTGGLSICDRDAVPAR